MELHWRRLGFIQFQSTPSTRRVTIQPLFVPPIKIISIHTLHTEGDAEATDAVVIRRAFQSTPSTRRVTRRETPPLTEFPFQSTPSTRRVTSSLQIHLICLQAFQSTPSTRRVTAKRYGWTLHADISIHTLHTEGDILLFKEARNVYDFNPHPPHGG